MWGAAEYGMEGSVTAQVDKQLQAPLRTVLVGAGSLGQAFLKRLSEWERPPISLVAVATARHGVMQDPSGIDPILALNLVQSTGLGEGPPMPKLLKTAEPELLIECIPQNIRNGEPALSYLKRALDMGIHVVTANKTPVLLGLSSLRAEAEKRGLGFRFSATILDGLPVFSAVHALQGDAVIGFRAVLNATSSIVLEGVQDGQSRSRGLARAQAQGIAEADPVLDLDGWDAAAKVALLINLWMNEAFSMNDVAREGIEGLKDRFLMEEAKEGLRYRLLAEVERSSDGKLRASVEPKGLSPEDPLYGLSGGCGGICLKTRRGMQFSLLQGRHGVLDAADAMLRDALSIQHQFR